MYVRCEHLLEARGVDEIVTSYGFISEVGLATESITVQFPHVKRTDQASSTMIAHTFHTSRTSHFCTVSHLTSHTPYLTPCTSHFAHCTAHFQAVETFPLRSVGTVVCALATKDEAEAAWALEPKSTQGLSESTRRTPGHCTGGGGGIRVAPNDASEAEEGEGEGEEDSSGDEGGGLDDVYHDRTFEVDVAELDQIDEFQGWRGDAATLEVVANLAPGQTIALAPGPDPPPTLTPARTPQPLTGGQGELEANPGGRSTDGKEGRAPNSEPPTHV